MTIEFRTPPEDLVRVQRMLGALQRRPQWLLLLAMLYGSTVLLAAGGILIAMAGAIWGLLFTLLGVFVGVVAIAVQRSARPTLSKVRQSLEKEPWRDAPYRVRLDDYGVSWEIPNVASHIGWAGVAEIVDKAGYFLVIERNSAMSMVLAIPHRALAGEGALQEARDLFRRHAPAVRS